MHGLARTWTINAPDADVYHFEAARDGVYHFEIDGHGAVLFARSTCTALSALGIYNQGGFGVAHVLALLTLGAVLVGSVAEKGALFGKLSPYLQAVSYPAELVVLMYGETPGRSSFNTVYEIRDANDREQLYTTGESKVVWADQVEGKSIPVPEHIRKLLPEA